MATSKTKAKTKTKSKTEFRRVAVMAGSTT